MISAVSVFPPFFKHLFSRTRVDMILYTDLSLTRLFEYCLQISSILTNFVYRLHMRWFELNVLSTSKILRIRDMHNF